MSFFMMSKSACFSRKSMIHGIFDVFDIFGSMPVNNRKLKKYFQQIKRNRHNCCTKNNNCSLVINFLIDPIADTGVLTKLFNKSMWKWPESEHMYRCSTKCSTPERFNHRRTYRRMRQKLIVKPIPRRRKKLAKTLKSLLEF